MTTLLIELAGAQQAWGSRSRFATRATELAPTRSGVIGLIAAALGLERTAPLDRFRHLRFGVRIDQPGRLERDFQTTRSFDGGHSFPLSQRYYLADALFLVGLEGERTELAEYRRALAQPYFPLFLGRRSFPPAGPLKTELVDAALREALREAPWHARPHHRRTVRGETVDLEIITDALAGDPSGDSRHDVPESFDPRRRQYSTRDVHSQHIRIPHPEPRPVAAPARRDRSGDVLGALTDHDPFPLLSDEEI